VEYVQLHRVTLTLVSKTVSFIKHLKHSLLAFLLNCQNK